MYTKPVVITLQIYAKPVITIQIYTKPIQIQDLFFLVQVYTKPVLIVHMYVKPDDSKNVQKTSFYSTNVHKTSYN